MVPISFMGPIGEISQSHSRLTNRLPQSPVSQQDSFVWKSTNHIKWKRRIQFLTLCNTKLTLLFLLVKSNLYLARWEKKTDFGRMLITSLPNSKVIILIKSCIWRRSCRYVMLCIFFFNPLVYNFNVLCILKYKHKQLSRPPMIWY